MAAKRIQLASEPGKRRILLVEDHPIMRHGQVELINRESDLTVCGQAGTAAEALAAIPHLKPDLLLLDLNLPDKSGLELLKDVMAHHDGLPVLAVSMQDEALYALRVLRAGGRGYLMKHEDPTQLIVAIRTVLAGEVYVSGRMAVTVLRSLAGPAAAAPEDKLTDREIEVLCLFGEGWSTEEIARRLHLSSKTVDVHRANMKEKLGLKTTPEFMRFAIQWARAQGHRTT